MPSCGGWHETDWNTEDTEDTENVKSRTQRSQRTTEVTEKDTALSLFSVVLCVLRL